MKAPRLFLDFYRQKIKKAKGIEEWSALCWFCKNMGSQLLNAPLLVHFEPLFGEIQGFEAFEYFSFFFFRNQNPEINGGCLSWKMGTKEQIEFLNKLPVTDKSFNKCGQALRGFFAAKTLVDLKSPYLLTKTKSEDVFAVF